MNPPAARGTWRLAPAHHRHIRRHLVLLPVYFWLLYGWSVALTGLSSTAVAAGVNWSKRDFTHFYVLGTIANERNARALYDWDAQTAVVRRLFADPSPVFPPLYGPQTSMCFAPFARLSYAHAQQLWLTLTVILVAGCCYAVWRQCPRLSGERWAVAVLVLASPGLIFLVNYGQVSAVAVGCVTAAYFALRSGRRLLAGLFIGSLVYKPQFGLAAAVIFVFAREWQIVLGAAGAAIAQIAVGCLYWRDPKILSQYVGALGSYLGRLHDANVAAMLEPNKVEMQSWRAFFDLLPLSPSVALAAYALMAVATLALATACWRAKGPLALRYSVFLVATVLVDPHVYAYDLPLLAPAFLLVWDWTLGEGEAPLRGLLARISGGRLSKATPAWFLVLLYACYFLPACPPLAGHIQVSVLALGALGCVLAALLVPGQLALRD